MTLGNPLFSLLRDGFEEVRAYGELVVVDGSAAPLFHTGEVMGHYPARSLLKPYQAAAARLPEALWSPEGDLKYTAALGSISATAEQVAQLQQWWKGAPTVDKLGLPTSYPMDEIHRGMLRGAHQPMQRIFHTCFSKHLTILEGCTANGWSQEGYLSTSHPFHASLCRMLENYLHPRGELTFVTDGCLLPSPVLPLASMAELYRILAAGGREGELANMRDRMLARPDWIGGPGRLDSKWMEANPGKVIAKEGADGLWAIGVVPGPRHPKGLGIVLKLASGFHATLASVAMSRALEWLGLQPVCEIPKGQRALFHYQPGVKSSVFVDITPAVDEELAVFPGDVPYSRKVSMDTRRGQHLSLSSVQMTVHAGAHTDAPNHFEPIDDGIDTVALEKYAGACQVITVSTPRGQRVKPADLADPVHAPRVLLRTGSYPDPRHFNTDFVALSAELVDYLHARGVVLVGVDTPSIDASDCKELPAHHATTRAGMAILEGIVLDGVEDGIYELQALPLKLKGADASPVRAVLKKTI